MNVLPQLLWVHWSPWGINTIIKWILHPWVKKTLSIRIINKQNSPGYRHSDQRNSEPQQRKTIRVISQPFPIFRGPQLGPADLPSLGPVGLHFIDPPISTSLGFPWSLKQSGYMISLSASSPGQVSPTGSLFFSVAYIGPTVHKISHSLIPSSPHQMEISETHWGHSVNPNLTSLL